MSSHVRISAKGRQVLNDKKLTRELVKTIAENGIALENGETVKVGDSGIAVRSGISSVPFKSLLIAFLFCSSLSYGQPSRQDLENWVTQLEQNQITPADFRDLVAGSYALQADTFQVCRIISNTTPSNWWRKVDHRPYAVILYAVVKPEWNNVVIEYLDSKKHPLKPWIRVWEN